jgi:uncharacterized protein (TIGR03437 family)
MPNYLRISEMRQASCIAGLFLAVSGTLLAQQPITVTTPSLPFGGIQLPYNAQLTATGGSGSYSWTIAGNLPPGLGLTARTGVISGSPTLPGTYIFTVTANDTQVSIKGSKTLQIGIMQISTGASLPAGSTCASYSVTFAVSDGPPPPYSWTIAQGNAPPGLNLNSSTGVLSGTPTAGGNFSFTVQAFGTGNSANINASMNFFISVASLCITSPNPLPSGDVNSQYQVTLQQNGGKPPIQWSISSGFLPAGLNLDPSGVLSGVPTAAGGFDFSVQVQDTSNLGGNALIAAEDISLKEFQLTINPALAITTTSPLPAGTTNKSYSQTIVATGGGTPYTFTLSNPPAGLSLSAIGVLSGTPTANGTFTLHVSVTDSTKAVVTKDFQLVIGSSGPILQVTPVSIGFTAPSAGDSPAAQFIDVIPVGTQPVTFTVTIDGGTNGSAKPAWLNVKPLSATAPARLVVSVDQGTMPPGSYTGRINVVDPSQNTISAAVTLTVVNTPAALEVIPSFADPTSVGAIRLSAHVQTPGTLDQVLVVRNSGGNGPLGFAATIGSNPSFISSVTPNSGELLRNSPMFVHVLVNTQGLQVGSYRNVIHFTSPAGNVDVPIQLFVAASGSILAVDVTGVRFQARQGAGYSTVQSVKVLDIGDAGTTVNWTADFVNGIGSNLFTLTASGPTATPTNPGTLKIAPTQAALQMQPGGYYALIRITAPGAQSSPQYVVVVLDMSSSTSPALPDLSPAGLFFTAASGGSAAPSQPVIVNTSSSAAVPFEAAALTSDGASWLTVSPVTGNASSGTPGQVTVSVSNALAAGIYNGEVSISMSGVERTVNVTFVVRPAGTITALSAIPDATCAPSKLALTETGLTNNFGVPAGWPAALITQLNDDCGAVVTNGSVTANFSNGDPPLNLRGDGQNGTYSATWQPGKVSSQMVVTLQAAAGTLQPTTMQLQGGIAQNQAPVLFANGIVDPFFRVGGGPTAPGTIVEVYGTGLASSTASPGVLPLPPVFNGTYGLINGLQTPLFFLSAGQLDVLIPTELTATQQLPLIISANNAFTLPVTIDVVPLQPGVAQLGDGHIIAQHASDFSLVDAGHPAKPSEPLVMYLAGLGATNPSVASGSGAPGVEPLARVTVVPVVTVGGQTAIVDFAGLTPGLSGLYQVNFRVPASAPSGDLDVVVTQISTQGTITANTTKLTVSH